jgi:kumamolisin
MATRLAAACLFWAGFCGSAALAEAADQAQLLAGSVRLPDAGGASIGTARIVRALSQDEQAASFAFSVTLRMRDLDGLRGRIAGGQRVPEAQMEALYRPLPADYARVAAWLQAEGFALSRLDRTHTTVFARGTVSQLAAAFGVQFARVAVADGEYTSAVSAPTLPADLAAVILSVNALQPEFRLRHLQAAIAPAPRDLVSGLVYVTPNDVAHAYNFSPSYTGAGQTIAIVDEAAPGPADLSTFWITTGVAQTTANLATVDVNGGPAGSPADMLVQEADLDVEWAGAMAPGAALRLYLAPNVFDCITQVLSDAPSLPGMTVLSISFAATEGEEGDAVLAAYSQVFASLAAAGVSTLAGSGDSGSNPTPQKGPGFYSPSEPLGVTYPASDPSVTGVGGTAVGFEGSWIYTGETVWNEIAGTQSASGGGVSAYFPKPSWQTGGSVLASQAMRCVPDVAALSVGDLSNVTLSGFEPYSANGVGALIYEDGSAKYASGTSLACPIWAAVAASLNEARARAGAGPIGLLNPHLYPLAGTGALNDITSGSNGAYSAGPGYDLCTGLGSPDVGNLIQALLSPRNGSADPHLVNVSTRAEVETGSNIAIAGFYVQGAAGTLKNILVRGIGPALNQFGVAGALTEPTLSVFDASGELIASDTGWADAVVPGTSGVAADYRPATALDMNGAGAFALPADSADSAMVLRLPPGTYTAQVSGQNGGSGVGLAEVYALDADAPQVLANLSARCFVGTGSQVAISGFVVGGSAPAQLLIRGIGPALAGFGLTQYLGQPMVAVYDAGNALIVSDAGWGSPLVSGTSAVPATYRAATPADMMSVGAFPLAAGSADSALVVTLPPGSYTAVVSGVGAATGTALAEVYQLAAP